MNETTKKTKGITAGRVLRYTVTPELLPRLYSLFSSGFSHVAIFMAYLFQGVRLLPAHHPYLNPANHGRFGIRHIISEAHKHVSYDRKHIDQVMIFYTVVLGFALLMLQFGVMVASVCIQAANASDPVGTEYAKFFVTQNPEKDIAFNLLDRVFGIPGIFENGGTTTEVASGGNWPTAFHEGLHVLFHFYNVGILAVAMIIFIYYVVAVVAETAQSGTPFGQRFNKAWAPVRLILAVGLLMPLTLGFNGAQYLTLHVAKWGSGLATNAWGTFLTDSGTLSSAGGGIYSGWMDLFTGSTSSDERRTPLGHADELVALPSMPPLDNLVEFFFVVQACKKAYKEIYDRDISMYLIHETSDTDDTLTATDMSGMDYSTAINLSQRNNLIIRFGDEADNLIYSGADVRPTCGEIIFETVFLGADSSDTDASGAPLEGVIFGGTANSGGMTGGWIIRTCYFELLKDLWDDSENQTVADNLVMRYAPVPGRDPFAQLTSGANVDKDGDGTRGESTNEMSEYIALTKNYYNRRLRNPDTSGSVWGVLVTSTLGAQCDNIAHEAREVELRSGWHVYSMQDYGWGGAAIWYNKIAEINGTMVSAAYNQPISRKYPKIMEDVRERREAESNAVTGDERFNPISGSENTVPVVEDRDLPIALTLYQAKKLWGINPSVRSQGNMFTNAIVALFGLQGLFDLYMNSDVNPLAQLSAVGKSLIESSVMNFGFAFGSFVLGGLANIVSDSTRQIGTVARTASGFFGTIGLLGLSIGFILFYIIPMLPFVYFFLAVTGWVKGLFEAMVGLPLWALAHIRIDGEGIPGAVGMNGYYLIFEIFLRPVLIVFGLLASLIIFTAQVQVLNEVWELALANLAGSENVATEASQRPIRAADLGDTSRLRGFVDEFFLTIMYAVIVYMMALGSFKLIDLIPNNILRWLGASVQTFAETNQETAEGLVKNVFVGSQTVTGQFSGLASRTQQAFFATGG